MLGFAVLIRRGLDSGRGRIMYQHWLLNEPQTLYQARRAAFFHPARIVLAKGSLANQRRRDLVGRICAAYPDAEVVEWLDVPHNRVDLGSSDPLTLHYRGKQTLVFGEHRSAVRFSTEEGNACPNYWHFSPYGFCPYDCKYCYLAGTPGVRFSPAVKVFLNLAEILHQIDRAASAASAPVAFYLGKLQDGLALDPLTGYSRTLVPFFAGHPKARLIVLTKSADVDNLLDLDHGGHTILSWTLNAPQMRRAFESNTPPISERIDAMRKCAQAGYAVRAVVMPIIPMVDWQAVYLRFLKRLLDKVPLQRITLGGVCIYPAAQQLMELKLGRANAISRALNKQADKCPDGRVRFPLKQRVRIYRHLVGTIQRLRPDLPIALCLEERLVFEAIGVTGNIGRCNCVL